MCGIAGIWSPDGLEKERAVDGYLSDCIRLLRHRGPNDQGTWRDHHVAFSHTRLSIIDLTSAGKQPMALADNSVVLNFNGEIYNFQPLRRELEKLGHSFRSHSDTEVLLHGYRQWGETVLDRLRGMFAFAIWDATEHKLFLACDRVAQKPLYYAWHQGKFLFASEIRAILTWPGFPREVNLEAIHQYLTFQYVPSPLTAFKGIRKLKPAHKMVIDARGRVLEERYWSLPLATAENARGAADIKAELVERLEDVIRMQIYSDVPVGVFLSGGIDSASIVELVRRQTGRPIDTFTIGFREQGYDERRYARLVSEALGTNHHEIVVDPSSVDVLSELAQEFCQPFADPSSIPTFYLAKYTSAHVRVALSGDGGDEVFLGYPRYIGIKLSRLFSQMPHLIPSLMSKLGGALPFSGSRFKMLRYMTKLLADAHLSEVERYIKWVSFFRFSEKQDIYGPLLQEFLDQPAETILENLFDAASPRPSDAARVDIQTYLPDDLMVKMDVVSMTHSLEVRSPFLDHELMEFMMGIPESMKLKGLRTKHILKEVMAPFLPAPIIRRQKMGFGVPIDRWFCNEWKEFTMDLLLSDRHRSRGLFSPIAVERMLEEHIQGMVDHHYRLWALLVLEQWYRTWIDPKELPTQLDG